MRYDLCIHLKMVKGFIGKIQKIINKLNKNPIKIKNDLKVETII